MSLLFRGFAARTRFLTSDMLELFDVTRWAPQAAGQAATSALRVSKYPTARLITDAGSDCSRVFLVLCEYELGQYDLPRVPSDAALKLLAIVALAPANDCRC